MNITEKPAQVELPKKDAVASVLCKLANVTDNRANRRKMAKLAGVKR